MTEHCDHECVCNKYIDYTNTGATAGRACNGETWCFKQCPHDTRNRSAMTQQALANEKYFAINDTLITAIGEWDKEPHDIVRILSLLRAYPLPEHDAAIATQARETVLSKLATLIDNSKEYASQDRRELFHRTVLLCMIDSLRNMEQP